MNRYRVKYGGVLRRDGALVTDEEEAQAVIDRLLLELAKLPAADPVVRAEPGEGAITVSVRVEESEVFMASIVGFTQIHTAVHAAGWDIEWRSAMTARYS